MYKKRYQVTLYTFMNLKWPNVYNLQIYNWVNILRYSGSGISFEVWINGNECEFAIAIASIPYVRIKLFTKKVCKICYNNHGRNSDFLHKRDKLLNFIMLQLPKRRNEISLTALDKTNLWFLKKKLQKFKNNCNLFDRKTEIRKSTYAIFT